MSNTLFTIKFYQLQHYSSGKNLLQKQLSYAAKRQTVLSIKENNNFFLIKKLFDVFFTCQIIII